MRFTLLAQNYSLYASSVMYVLCQNQIQAEVINANR